MSFPEAYRKLQDKVKLEVPVLVRGGLRIEEGVNPKLTANDIIPLEDAKVPLPRSLRIRIPLETANDSTGRRTARPLYPTQRRSESVV